MHKHDSSRRGFTIVELLVVIVVIGILASITIVSYQGVTQRADNVRRIEAARQVQTLLQLYAAMYGKSPVADSGGTGGFCLTVDNNCSDYAGVKLEGKDNTALIAELSKVGKVPQSVNAPAVTKGSGTIYHYEGLYFDSYLDRRKYNGVYTPALMMFWLNGNDQNCALQDTVIDDPNATLDIQFGTLDNQFIPTTTGYTYSVSNFPDDEGVTECWVSVPISN